MNELMNQFLNLVVDPDIFEAFAINLLSTNVYNRLKNKKAKSCFKSAFKKALKHYNKNNGTNLDIDLSEVENSIDSIKNKKFITCLAEQLRKTDQGYLYLLEYKLDEINNDLSLKSLMQIDERHSILYNDNINFLEIYPSAKISVRDLYVEPHYKIIRLNDDGSDIISDPDCYDSFIQNCKTIMNKERILFISGPYGHGKTFLSKMILSEIDDGFSLFIYASNLPSKNFEFLNVFNDDAISSLIDRYGKLYVFIDSFEDILIENSIDIFDVIKSKCQTFSDLFFIINYRTSVGLRPMSIYECLSDVCKTNYAIELCSFTKPKITEWMENYYEANEKNEDEDKKRISFTIEHINDANKNLKESFRNPLLLLIMSLNDITTNDINSQNWFSHFDNFVDKTIHGKFAYEQKSNAFLRKKGVDKIKYKEIVSKAALEILKRQNNQFGIEDFEPIDYFLDPNSKSYSESSAVINQVINSCLSPIKSDDQQITIKEEESERYLNCYFFECIKTGDKKEWKFRDNNILFFLAAYDFYYNFENTYEIYRRQSNISQEEAKDLFICIEKLPLHPVIIEFILSNIKYSVKYNPDALMGLIYTMIQNKIILNLPNESLFKLDYNKIKVDILFFIIYIRFHSSSYIEEYDGFIFKRIFQYYSFIKKIDEDVASVLKRYFNNASIIGVQFRGINLKKYNWTNSKFSNVIFYRCKIDNSTFYRNLFRNTKFSLCYIKDIKFIEVGGNIQIKTSELYKTEFIFPDNNIFGYNQNNSSIELNNCIIDDVSFVSDEPTSLEVTLNNCQIRQLHFNCKHVKLNLFNSVLYSQIDLKETELTISYSSIICIKNEKYVYNYQNKQLDEEDDKEDNKVDNTIIKYFHNKRDLIDDFEIDRYTEIQLPNKTDYSVYSFNSLFIKDQQSKIKYEPKPKTEHFY